jgi:exodeoxyribonuclease VII small subunit
MSQDDSIGEKVDRIETIIDRLEGDDVSLERAQELHEEGRAIIDDLRDDLDVGDGTVVER